MGTAYHHLIIFHTAHRIVAIREMHLNARTRPRAHNHKEIRRDEERVREMPGLGKKWKQTLQYLIGLMLDADANDTNKNNKYQKLSFNLWLRSLEMALQCLLDFKSPVRHDSCSHSKSMLRERGENERVR